MNDKCAAGTGRGVEVIADLLAVPIEEIGGMSLMVTEDPDPVSSVCVIFAKTEVGSLMRAGRTREEVLAAYCRAMAIRVAKLLEKVGMEKDFAITGGIAKNIGVVSRIEKILGIEALKTDQNTQIAGALGAALLAYEKVSKES
jgi:activator of 2-hydroxyglutaryl-CoA dehydratase